MESAGSTKDVQVLREELAVARKAADGESGHLFGRNAMSSPVSLPVPGFRAQAVLGQDRMSTVWLAADERGRTAVLTIGHRVLAGQTDRGALVAWAATLSRVAASPSIADVPAYGITEDGRPYPAIETGVGTLADRVVAKAITPPEAQTYGMALSEALAAVHVAGLAHGAVRPATILLSGDRPVLSGFDAVAPGLGQPLTLDVFTSAEHLGAAMEGRIAATRAMSGPGRGGGYGR